MKAATCATAKIETDERADPDVSTTEAEVLFESELARVIDWRRRELQRAGYDDEAAREIAERLEIDLHRAIDLLKSGCPHETAVRILL